MERRTGLVTFSALVLVATSVSVLQAQKTAETATTTEAVLKAPEVGEKLFPDKVFFRGQVTTVQARNSCGVRYTDEFLVLAALVDSSGYASGLKEKYQGYLLTEVPIAIGGKTLKPGAYGFGFLEGNIFMVMDLGAHDVLEASSTKDTEITRPVPLQVRGEQETGHYRLYKGREYVEFQRLPSSPG